MADSTNYGFVITRDHVDGSTRKLLRPRSTPLTADEILAVGVPFRLLDRKRVPRFEGMYHGPSGVNQAAPLDDFGEAVAGCMFIQYPDHNRPGEWVDL